MRDDRFESGLAGLSLAIVASLVALVCISSGCRSCEPCKPVVIEVPVPVAGPALPEPVAPQWRTPTADPANPLEYIRAMTHDLLEAWRWSSELRHVIDSHNRTIAADVVEPDRPPEDD